MTMILKTKLENICLKFTRSLSFKETKMISSKEAKNHKREDSEQESQCSSDDENLQEKVKLPSLDVYSNKSKFPLSSIPLPPSEASSTPKLKRRYSTSDESDDSNSYGSRMNHKSSYCNKSSTSLPNLPILKSRRSLPAVAEDSLSQSAFETPKRLSTSNISSKRYSFPYKNSPYSNYRTCSTDQTPYSPISSYQRPKRFKSNLPSYNASDVITIKSDYGFIDSHCHIDFLFQRQNYEGSYESYQEIHKDTFPKSYKGCLAIFCNPFSFEKKHIWEPILKEENVWASFGCHPHNAHDFSFLHEESLIAALDHPKVCALGEIGLDYSNRNKCLKEIQHKVFKCQLKIALERKLPLVIHCRDAHDDCMEIMKETVPKNYFIHLHCFTDSWEWAKKWLNEFPNLFIGLTNLVTFPSAEQVHEVARNIPLNRLLLETDAPYFIPKPLLKDHPNLRFSHPGMAIHVAAQVAALKEVPLEQVLRETRQNTKTVYKI